MEFYELYFELYLGNMVYGSYVATLLKEFVIPHFMQEVQKIANDSQPMKIVMKRPVQFYDDIEKKTKVIWHEIEFKNRSESQWPH